MPIDTGNTAWMLFSTVLVMMMTPALGFFEAGLLRNKNALNILLKIFTGLALLSILWVVVGFSLSFSPSSNGIIGGLDWSFFRNVPYYDSLKNAPTVPGVIYGGYEMMFAVVTPLLITGSFAGRLKLNSFLVFIIAWSFLVYYPLAHLVWGKGLLQNLGVYDFAGGIVVHTSAGISSLAAAFFFAKRRKGNEVAEPSNIPLAVIGAALLWVGWFGFNAGSALVTGTLSPNQYAGLASNVLVVTQISSAASALVWIFHSWRKPQKSFGIAAINGAIAGLAGVTAASGYITISGGLVLGIIIGFVSYYAKKWLSERKKINDGLDVSSIHGSTGIVGSLAIGVIATVIVNPVGPNGLLYGNPSQLGVQALGVAVAVAIAFGGTALIMKIIDVTIGLKEKEEQEEADKDESAPRKDKLDHAEA